MKVYLDDFQVTNCQVPESAKTMLPLLWGDLTSCLALKRIDIPPTNKPSLKRFQLMMHTFYIGKILTTSFQPTLLPSSSGLEKSGLLRLKGFLLC